MFSPSSDADATAASGSFLTARALSRTLSPAGAAASFSLDRLTSRTHNLSGVSADGGPMPEEGEAVRSESVPSPPPSPPPSSPRTPTGGRGASAE